MVIGSKEVVMTPQNVATQNISTPPNVLGLPDGLLEQLSQEAVAIDLQRKLEKGVPILVWNDGLPYHKHPDGRIEYIQI
jgi:hypothetical protein